MKSIAPKKIQINKNQTMIFGSVAVASIMLSASIVISQGLWKQSRYYGKVIDKKETALQTLQTNEDEVRKLTDSYNTFNQQSPNLMGGNIDGTGERDGPNANLVLGALPNTYDFPALVSSVEKMLVGYSVDGIVGTDDSLSQAGNSSNQPVEIPLSFSVTTDYTRIKELLGSFDKSIRPFAITRLDLSGTGATMKADISAKTYYQPSTSLKITEEVVKK